MASVDLSKQKNEYSVCVVKSGISADTQIYIEDLVTSIEWSGSISNAARKLAITYMKHNDVKVNVHPGDMLILRRVDNNNKEIMRGMVVNKSVSSSGRSVSCTAYDARWWFLRNKHDHIYRNMTATQIVSSCCKQFGVPVGNLFHTNVNFPSIQVINKTVWDTIVIALTETRKVSGYKYMTKMINGKLHLVWRNNQTHQWVLEEKVNLMEADYTESIEDTFTQVKVVGKTENKGKISTVVKKDSLISKYGILQEYIEQAEAKSQSEINQIANQKLKELAVLNKSGSVTALGIDEVEAGDGIYVIDKNTGLNGGFWVESDTHTVTNRHHTMNLNLCWTDELPEIEYEEPKEEG